MSKKNKYNIFMEFYDGIKQECDNIQNARTMEFYRQTKVKDGMEDVINGWNIECHGAFCGDSEKCCEIKKEKLINAVFEWKQECEYVPRKL